MKNIFYFFSLMLGLVSCKDKTIEDIVATQPVFTFSGNINGSPLHIAAGVDTYESHFVTEQDFFGIYNYNSMLSPGGCNQCGPSIKIKLFGLEEKGPNDLPNSAIDLAVDSREYLTLLSTTNNLSFHFFANQNDNDLDHYWSFGDGGISTQNDPEHTYDLPGTYTVTHTIENAENVSSTVSFIIEAGVPNSFCSLPFQVNENGPNNFHFHHPFNLPPFLDNVIWTISDDDGAVIYSTNQDNFAYNLPADEEFEICLIFVNEITGCEGSYCLTIDNNEGPFIDPGFQIAPDPVMPTIGKVVVEYRDINGQLYHSAIEENNINGFEIIESSLYTPLYAGSPITRKLSILLNCTLENTNDANDHITLENAQAIFAFGIE